MCKHAVQNLPYLVRHVPDRHKTQQMYDKAILENGGTLKFGLTATKIKKCVIKQLILPSLFLNSIRLKTMCNKAVDTYPSTIKFVPECYKAQEMCHEAVNRCFLYLIQFLIGIKLKKCVTVLLLKILIS